MSLKVIELNDSAVTVSDETGLLLQSPGFALVDGNRLEVGRAAEQKVRLQPTSSFNKFWHQLSLDPLGYRVGNVRHFADLAYAHLLHVAEEAGLDGDVIMAVPGNFTSQQLAILLGLARQCPFNPVGLVDAALARAVRLARAPSVIFADVQLHQALLTRFSMQDGQLQRDSVIQIPEAGLQNFTNLVMQLVTGLFVQQCRFNPQHNAESEQQLYNEIPVWLARHREERSSLLMEIRTASATHEAKLPWESLVQRLAGHYERINQQIAALLAGQDSQLIISSSLANLPDYTRSLRQYGEVQVAAAEITGKACIELSPYINGDAAGIRFVTSVPVQVQGQAPGLLPQPAGERPTHVLFDSIALPIGQRVTIGNAPGAARASVNGSSIRLALEGMPEHLGAIEAAAGGAQLLCGEGGARVNGRQVEGRCPLALGDLVQFGDNPEGIRLIRVSNVVP